MIKISQLALKNIGPYKDQLFDFSIQKGHPDIHILTGANGTGKTTILHALASAFDFFEKDHKEHLSNNFYKRFHFFEEDQDKVSKSYANTTVYKNDTIIDKMHCYGCENCQNTIHKSYAKNLKNDFNLSRKDLHRNFPKSDDLINYTSALIAKTLNNRHLNFAAFGYSGYRFIESQNIEFNNNHKYNPLHLALEFVKEKKSTFYFSNWVISRFSKAAIEEVSGNKETADKYRKALNLFIQNINDLTDNEYSIKVGTNPWRVDVTHYGKLLEFDVLPDGLRSIMSWLGDLLMRLDEIPWENKDIPITEQNIILFLDEIEVHLHPTWQYKILPLVQKLLPNAQIFVSTHSPFIINSIDNAKVYILKNVNGTAQLTDTILSDTGNSYNYVYEHILNTSNIFGDSTMQDIKRFNQLDAEIVQKNYTNEAEFKTIVQRLLTEGEEVIAIISSKLFRLKRVTGKDYLNGENN